ncbi:helix-turn-helix domain-containing protein [Methylobacterium marchantiae]|uniref:Helix-turn-helix domain-containing protein n=1 Tax=Methylobacterium marchantiae TaxID=600331 RepID=A0ABW3X0R8_9HYPH|nr:hypothetical protein AIGOOFII_2022 [Methylobacterium marchantiae]
MSAVGDIAKSLRTARTDRGLSQAALGELTGLPQSHISKIESGAVDLQLSSLIALARVLDLDVRLVPRKALPAVDSIVRTTAPSADTGRLARLHDNLRRIADMSRAVVRLDPSPDAERLADLATHLQTVTIPREAMARVEKAVDRLRLLQRLPLATANAEALARHMREPGVKTAMRSAARTLGDVRSDIVRHPAVAEAAIRPAYTLDEEEDDA